MDKKSFINSSDPDTIDKLYQDFLSDPRSVSEDWRHFFEGFEFARQDYKPKAITDPEYPSEFKVITLINAYRQRGHLFTATNPVRVRRKYSPTLDYTNFGFVEADMNTVYQAGNELGIGPASLREIIAHLNKTYCASIGVEFMYIRHPEVVGWLKKRMEKSRNTPDFSNDQKHQFLKMTGKAVLFEKFIHKKFPGQKRFSLEGAESLIPALDAITRSGSAQGIKEFVIGMPHRGRLNVLANFMEKPYETLFHEFAGDAYEEEYLLGDVKYHLGYTTKKKLEDQEVKLTLSPNPSHLEAVDPVVEGISRARIDKDYKGDYRRLAPILIHGDASIAGQGVVYEVLQMSELTGYRTGGTIHLVINNQIGFTTNYLDARSSTYCTDVAKTTLSPVFHVNGDDVEAVVHTIQLAMEFRQKFHKDVFIDLLCYRKYGHNEGDEPRFTQPMLYKIIEQHPNPLEIYRKKLIAEGVIQEADAKETDGAFNSILEESLEKARKMGNASIGSFLKETWHEISKASPVDFEISPDTGVKEGDLLRIGKKICSLPPDEKLFRKLTRLQQNRLGMLEGEGVLDWAMGELLAYGTLLDEGIPVRLSGQDVARGTFSHRHAVLKIEDSEKEYLPLNHISEEQARIEIYNSSLSEYGVLGFEYGYALASPNALTIWEAQFGDFANGAQIIFDQFLSSAEDKWNVMNDLVVLLPHGYEGQGPEHSSARMERFLNLCAEYNMQIVNASTPANFFHVLRRQLKRKFRKPLIIFTPKSLLRHPLCVSPLKDFATGGFQELIDDSLADPQKTSRVIFCTGKIYYELLEEKQKHGLNDTAIIRLEQLFPLPLTQIRNLIIKYKHANDWVWVQEEPVNMGAWPYIKLHFHEVDLRLVARPASGSPATGSSKFHMIRHQKIIEKSFGECDCPMVEEECRMMCIGNRWRSFDVEIQKLKDAEVNTGMFSAKKKLKPK
ncbi:MAG: 2-oxoglutarate dehydrogenase E1 component [Bacteroidota bacterium]